MFKRVRSSVHDAQTRLFSPSIESYCSIIRTLSE